MEHEPLRDYGLHPRRPAIVASDAVTEQLFDEVSDHSPPRHSDQGDRVEGGPPMEEVTGSRHLHRHHLLTHVVLHLDLPLKLNRKGTHTSGFGWSLE